MGSESTLKAGRYRILAESATRKFKTFAYSPIFSLLWEKAGQQNFPCRFLTASSAIVREKGISIPRIQYFTIWDTFDQNFSSPRIFLKRNHIFFWNVATLREWFFSDNNVVLSVSYISIFVGCFECSSLKRKYKKKQSLTVSWT